jgi:putative endonuclease
MPFVYILFSKAIHKFYTGSCNDLEIRLNQHRQKIFDKAFTKKADDWEIVWKIYINNAKDARIIEHKIKQMKSKIYIQNLIKYPEMTLKLLNF